MFVELNTVCIVDTGKELLFVEVSLRCSGASLCFTDKPVAKTDVAGEAVATALPVMFFDHIFLIL